MINILEAVDLYNDTWLLTFYFVLGISLLIGTAWTYYQMFVKGEKKKQPLKENIIYNQSDDVIEHYDMYSKKKENQVPMNNYQLKDFNTINEDIFDDTSKSIMNEDLTINNSIKTNDEIEDPYKDISIDDNNLNNENTKTKQADEHQDNDIIVKDNLISKSEDLNITNNMNTSNERQKKKTNKKSNNKNKYYYKTNKKNNNYYYQKHQ